MQIMPTQKTPPLQVETVNNGIWTLKDRSPENFTLIVFYRGLHCPVCKKYLSELNEKYDEFVNAGVEAIAVSADSKERATQAVKEWGLDKLPVAFSFDLKNAADWGLFVSAHEDGSDIDEPAHFNEPAVFIVNPDETLYASSVQNMPFARPPISQLIDAVTFVKEHNYPPRGKSMVA